MSADERAPGGIAGALAAGDPAKAAELLVGLGALHALPTASGAEGGARTDEGEFVAFYFTEQEDALAYAREHGFSPAGDPVPAPTPRPPLDALRASLARGDAGVVLDPGSERSVVLTRASVAAILEVDEAAILEGDEPPGREAGSAAGDDSSSSAAGAGGATPRGLEPPPHLLALADRVRRSPDLEPVPPPDIDPGDATAVVEELRQLHEAGRIPLRDLLETLAWEVAFHVPVAPASSYGLRWPLVVRHPERAEAPTVWIFTDPELARSATASLPGEASTVRLSGIEAFRWIWALPTPVEEVFIDLHPGAEGALSLPDIWLLGVLYPHFLDLPDLAEVPAVPPDRIGALPGARGGKAECIRSLLDARDELVFPEADTHPVEHGGRRYLPLHHSSVRRASGTRDPGGAPAGARDSSPFRDGLVASTQVSGLLLDPEGPHPLPLDHADLALLALRDESGTEGSPDGADLVRLLIELGPSLGPGTVGRVLADWPGYYWALQPGSSDESPRAMTLPGRDACPVFATEDGILEFLERLEEEDVLDVRMQPLSYLTGWAFNVFQEMRVRYRDGGWIDPDPEAVLRVLHGEADELTGGLPVEEETVRSALGRIEWRLQPRVPGFLADT